MFAIPWQAREYSKQLTISDTMFFPNTKASPDVGGRRPTSIEIVVLLPAPLCPSKSTINEQRLFLPNIDKAY